jgi:hypothetical protein
MKLLLKKIKIKINLIKILISIETCVNLLINLIRFWAYGIFNDIADGLSRTIREQSREIKC